MLFLDLYKEAIANLIGINQKQNLKAGFELLEKSTFNFNNNKSKKLSIFIKNIYIINLFSDK